MIRLAVTGNIACGKSLVGDHLQSLGYPVIDSDKSAHELLQTQNTITEEILKLCTPKDIRGDNSFIDRQKLGQIFFSDALLKSQIESIMHPAIAQNTEEFFVRQEAENHFAAANLIPLLFENKAEHRHDYIVLVRCEAKTQLKRLLKRNPHLSLEQAQIRINSQIPQAQKEELSDYIIDNSGTPEHTRLEVERFSELLYYKFKIEI